MRFNAIVFRPFKGEVLDAVVTQVNKLGFFAQVGPLQVFVSKHLIPSDMRFDPQSTPPAYVSEVADETPQRVQKDAEVRRTEAGPTAIVLPASLAARTPPPAALDASRRSHISTLVSLLSPPFVWTGALARGGDAHRRVRDLCHWDDQGRVPWPHILTLKKWRQPQKAAFVLVRLRAELGGISFMPWPRGWAPLRVAKAQY